MYGRAMVLDIMAWWLVGKFNRSAKYPTNIYIYLSAQIRAAHQEAYNIYF